MKTIRDVVTSDLTPGAYKQAMEAIGEVCYYCRRPLGDTPAIAVYAKADRDQRNWAVYPYMAEGRIVSPGGFAHLTCQLLAEDAAGVASKSEST